MSIKILVSFALSLTKPNVQQLFFIQRISNANKRTCWVMKETNGGNIPATSPRQLYVGDFLSKTDWNYGINAYLGLIHLKYSYIVILIFIP